MQLMRNFAIVKLAYTPSGMKRRELDKLRSQPPKAKRKNDQRIKVLKTALEGNTEPEFYEIAVVPPSPDFFVRNVKEILPLATFEEAKSDQQRVEDYIPIFYEKYDLVTKMVCDAVRDPADLNRKIIVPDYEDPEEDQVRISEWNIPLDVGLFASQGYFTMIRTPACAVLWVILKLTGNMIFIADKSKRKQEDNEDIDTFPEDSGELAEGAEDPSVAGSSELSDRPDRSGGDDPGTSEIEDGHQSMGTVAEGDQEVEP